MKKGLSIVLALCLTVILLAGCGSKSNNSESSAAASSAAASPSGGSESGGTEKQKIKVGFSFASKEGVIYQAFEDYYKKAAKEFGDANGKEFDITFTVADGDVGKQASNIEDLINQKPDVIVMMAQDSKAIESSIKAAHKAGIKVLTYNRGASPEVKEQPDAHVGLDSFDQAYTTGTELFKLMKAEGVEAKVLNVMGGLTDENAVNRDKGMKKAAEEAGAVIVQDIPTDWNPDKALSGLSAALQAHPEATAIFVASDFLLPGVQAAMERAKKWIPYGTKGHLYFGSQDVYPSGAQNIKEGIIDVNTSYDIWTMSTKAIEVTDALVSGKEIAEKNILVKGRVVTQKNLTELDNIWANDYKE